MNVSLVLFVPAVSVTIMIIRKRIEEIRFLSAEIPQAPEIGLRLRSSRRCRQQTLQQ